MHEVGHALGLSGFARDKTLVLVVAEVIKVINKHTPLQIPVSSTASAETEVYESAHPSTPEAAMNYDYVTGVPEPDCAPHPLDVLAIFALYQSPVSP